MNIEHTVDPSYLPCAEEEAALRQAIKTTLDSLNPSQEEVGGFIIEKDGYYEYKPITNANKGTAEAFGLYTADVGEFAREIVPLITAGYRVAASFHYHPGWSAQPSSIDLNQLFQSFKKNYIFADNGDLKLYQSISSPQDEQMTIKELFSHTHYLTRNDKKATIWQSLSVQLSA